MSEMDKNLEALQIALKTEEDGYALYKDAAAQQKNEVSQAIFTRLAKDELLHMDLIKRFYTNLRDVGNWAELTEEEKNYQSVDAELQTIFSEALNKAKDGKIQLGKDDIQVYEKAVQFEKKGMEMYDRCYNEASEDTARKFYSFLREMEREHMEMLDKTLQYFNNPDNYYLLEEGWTLDD